MVGAVGPPTPEHPDDKIDKIDKIDNGIVVAIEGYDPLRDEAPEGDVDHDCPGEYDPSMAR